MAPKAPPELRRQSPATAAGAAVLLEDGHHGEEVPQLPFDDHRAAVRRRNGRVTIPFATATATAAAAATACE